MDKTNLDYGNQLIVITGGRGIGKTQLAATYLPPSRVGEVFYHDSEDSANNILAGLESLNLSFGHYNSLRQRFGDLPGEDDLLSRINDGKLPWIDNKTRNALIDYYLYILDDLKTNLNPNGKPKYTVYVHDTIEKLEAGMAAWVTANKRSAGVTTEAFGKLWSEGVFPLYEQFLSAIHARGIQTIILTSHLKTPWEGNRPVTGKVVPSGKKLLYYLSRLMIWVVREQKNPSGAPAGLILKERLASLNVTGDEWQVERRLPRRIPVCTWTNIRKYLVNGCDLINPVDGETLSTYEDELIQDLALSDKQMELMILEAKRDLELAKTQSVFTTVTQPEQVETIGTTTNSPDEFTNTVKELANSGLSPIEIKNELMKKYIIDATVPAIIKALKRQ